MTDTRSTLLAELSHDIILCCDSTAVVREANPVALRLLGPRIIGKGFARTLSTMSRPKAETFLLRLQQLAPGEMSEPWELLFHVPRAAPLFASVRAGALGHGGWLLVGGCEPPTLTALYHEVLAINSELTTLVRSISKEQAALSAQLARYLPVEEDDHAH